jgi:hypothetical protein
MYHYVLLDPRKPVKLETSKICFLYEPIYVGKGKKSRRSSDHFGRTDHHPLTHKIKKIQKLDLLPFVIKPIENLILEEDSYYAERSLISEIGTICEIKDIKRGPLTNLTAGGEGAYGRKHSQETILKYKQRIGNKNPFYGRKHSRESLELMSKSTTGKNNGMYGHYHNDISKQKISENRSGIPAWNQGVPRTEEEIKKISSAVKLAMAEPEKRKRFLEGVKRSLEKRRGKITIWKNGSKKIILPHDYTDDLKQQGWVRSKKESLTLF